MPPSEPMTQYDIFRDQLAIKYPVYGHALWEPNPGGLQPAVEIGDVGCILQGKFLRLFNVLLPANHPSHEKSGVPESYEPLKPSIPDHLNSNTLGPENLCSAGVTESSAHPGGVGQTSVRGSGAPVEISLSCKNMRGAALLLPVRVQREDTDARGEFAEWMVKHIDRWFSFAKGLRQGIERMEDIILVTGRHLTRSWANIAFIENQGSARRGPMQVSLGVHVSESFSSHFSVDWKLPREPGQGVVLNMGPSGEDLSVDQCVFIRGFRVTRTHQVLNRFRDKQSIPTPTANTYRDPLSSLLEYIANQDPHSDMVLVHDDDLARFNEISPISSLETLQRHGFLAHLQEVQPEIQRVLSGPPSVNDSQKVTILSKERQGRYSGTQNPPDQSAPTSGIGRNIRSFLSKVPRKNLSSSSNSPQQVLPQDKGRNLDVPIRLSAYIADVDYIPPPSSLNSANLTSDQQPNPSSVSPFTRWSPTLLQITKSLELLAQSSSLERIDPLGQDTEKEPLDLVLRRNEVRLLMRCASLSPAEFASTEGISQPSALNPYYPTGDPEQGKHIALTTAMNCCDALKVLHSGNDAASVAANYLELSQALSDLGLLHSAFTTSDFALETFNALHTAAPDIFSLSVASVLSVRANILADLKKIEDAVKAADEAVALCQDNGSDPVPEVVYRLLDCAVLLCSVGRKGRGAAVALTLVELLGEANDSRFDAMHISSLCRLCIADAHVEVDSALALSKTEEVIEATRNSLGMGPQSVLAGAHFTKSKVLSAQNQDHLAHVASAEAITLLRVISAQRPVFSLILAHALDTHSQQLLGANQTTDSYSVAKEAVELWRSLMMSAPALISPFRRPLGWALVHQAKFRHKSNRRKAMREELELAQFAVMLFRLVTPLDVAGLATALYIVADRMRELDESRDAAPFAEEAVTRLQELSSEAPDTYSLDLIFSLSLASSCLAGTERASDALKYARDAVDEQRDREGAEDAQYDIHLRVGRRRRNHGSKK